MKFSTGIVDARVGCASPDIDNASRKFHSLLPPPEWMKFLLRNRLLLPCFFVHFLDGLCVTALLIFTCYLEETLLSDGPFQQPTLSCGGFTHTEDLLGIQISWEWVT